MCPIIETKILIQKYNLPFGKKLQTTYLKCTLSCTNITNTIHLINVVMMHKIESKEFRMQGRGIDKGIFIDN